MHTIRVHGVITPDRQLLVELPNDLPIGEVQVDIYATTAQSRSSNGDGESAGLRARLLAAGVLSTALVEDAVLTDEEIAELTALEREEPLDDEPLVSLPPGAPGLQELLDEIRGSR